MQKLVSVAIATFAALALACGGPARPKLKEIEATYQGSDDSWVNSRRLEYNGDKLTDITTIYEGEVWSRTEIAYADGKVDTVRYTNLVDSRTTVISIDYDGDNVGSYTATTISSNGTESELLTYDFEYDSDDRIEKQTCTVTSTGENSKKGYSELEYDNDGRLSLITDYFNGIITLSELDYDNGLLRDIIVSFSELSTPYSFRFAYNDEQKLESVTVQGGGSYSLEYNDDNRIESAHHIRPDGDTYTTRYEYGDGSIAQLIPNPNLAWGDLFDMEGERLEAYQALPGLPLLD